MMFLGRDFSNVATIPAEVHDEFMEEAYDTLPKWGHECSDDGLNEIWDVWKENKGWIWNLFSGSPYWNGKGQIVISHDFPRYVDNSKIRDFADWVIRNVEAKLNPAKIGFFGFSEMKSMIRRIHHEISELGCCQSPECWELAKRKEEEYNFYQAVYEKKTTECTYYTKSWCYEGDYYKAEDINPVICWNAMMKDLISKDLFDREASEDFAKVVNQYFPEAKASAGTKCSRIITKICKMLGVNTESDYNPEFTKFADATNPLAIKRHTVLSINPMDFWLMSNGNSWNSCHDIWKDRPRDQGNSTNYHGCYCSGTESYMLDGASFVFYTVDKAYNGNQMEMQRKVQRQMFHIGEDKIFQIRLYPLDNADGKDDQEVTDTYREIREIVQRLIAEAAGAINLWKVEKGVSNVSDMISGSGTHYNDYDYNSNETVSYWKGNGVLDYETIYVGHDPICPNCGEEHEESDWLCCSDCREEKHYCNDCGCLIDRDEEIEIDGEYYCRDCVEWCDYHARWERTCDYEFTYISRYGTVCDDALEYSGEFVQVEDPERWNTDWMSINDVYTTEDGRYFRSLSNMLDEGYDEDGNIIREDEEEEVGA